MPARMNIRYGACRNPLTCSLAESRAIIPVVAGAGFVCPECARPLVEDAAAAARLRRGNLTVAGGLVLMLASAVTASVMIVWPKPSRPVAAAKPGVPPQPERIAAATPARALVAVPAQAQPAAPAMTRPAITPDVHAIWPGAPAWPAPPPPQTLALLNPSPRKAPSALSATVHKPPPAAPAPAPPAEEAARAPAALQRVTSAPAAAIDTPETTAKRPRIVVLPPSSRFSLGPLQGVNLPSLPSHMVFVNPSQITRPGSVQADCRIGLDGVPADCRMVSVNGAAEMSDTILAWLGSGAIRYTPAIKNGHKVVARRVLTVNFGGKAAEAAPFEQK